MAKGIFKSLSDTTSTVLSATNTVVVSGASAVANTATLLSNITQSLGQPVEDMLKIAGVYSEDLLLDAKAEVEVNKEIRLIEAEVNREELGKEEVRKAIAQARRNSLLERLDLEDYKFDIPVVEPVVVEPVVVEPAVDPVV